MRMSRAQDGEVIRIAYQQSATSDTDPTGFAVDRSRSNRHAGFAVRFLYESVDGIVFDSAGNPIEYHVLQIASRETIRIEHDFDRVPADAMIHLFRSDRPGQARGIPDITPALPLFAQLRRFTLAVLAAAETAADFAGILYTDAPANGEADAAEPFEPIELEKRMLLDDARRLEDAPDAGRATSDNLWRVQARNPERDRSLFEHAVQHRCRKQRRDTTTLLVDLIIRPTTSRSASSNRRSGIDVVLDRVSDRLVRRSRLDPRLSPC